MGYIGGINMDTAHDDYMETFGPYMKWLETIKILAECRVRKNPDEQGYIDLASRALKEVKQMSEDYMECIKYERDWME